MNLFIAFLIAIAVGLTSIGGGSFTVPALIVLVGLTAGGAVGTAFVFAGVLRLIAAPFYLLGRNFHARCLWLLLLGAIPGLLLGTLVHRLIGQEGRNPVVIILLGVLLAASSRDRKSTRLNSSHSQISYAVFCLKKKKKQDYHRSRYL